MAAPSEKLALETRLSVFRRRSHVFTVKYDETPPPLGLGCTPCSNSSEGLCGSCFAFCRRCNVLLQNSLLSFSGFVLVVSGT